MISSQIKSIQYPENKLLHYNHLSICNSLLIIHAAVWNWGKHSVLVMWVRCVSPQPWWREGGGGFVRQRRSFVQSSLKRLVFDFLLVRVGNSAAPCELVRSPRPTVVPFFADPWQQICSNDIVSSWVITHNSDGHTLHCCRNRGERRITLKH